jgi:hypothetical protein
MFWRRRKEQELADAREEALRWYDRLGGQITNLPAGDTAAVKQAMVDAGERYNAAGAQLDRAETPKQYALARETALEGLSYIRAARVALELDPGPELPALAGQQRAGALTQDREVDVDGRQYKASPRPANDTPYYYPGGVVQGRPVPSGWYSEPWWKTALVAGAAGVGSMLVFDALFGGIGGYGGGYGGFEGGYDRGYDQGFDQGAAYADQQGWDQGGGAADMSYDTASYDTGFGDPGYGGGFDAGGFDSGGFGGDFTGDF